MQVYSYLFVRNCPLVDQFNLCGAAVNMCSTRFLSNQDAAQFIKSVDILLIAHSIFTYSSTKCCDANAYYFRVVLFPLADTFEKSLSSAFRAEIANRTVPRIELRQES